MVVVSHDKETASKYADRIIKISDGLIIEDNNKTDITVSDLDNKLFDLIERLAKLRLLYDSEVSVHEDIGPILIKKAKDSL